MSWKSGTGLAIDLWRGVRTFIEPGNQVQALACLIKEFEKHDWDGAQYLEDEEDFPEAKEAVMMVHPEWADEEEEE